MSPMLKLANNYKDVLDQVYNKNKKDTKKGTEKEIEKIIKKWTLILSSMCIALLGFIYFTLKNNSNNKELYIVLVLIFIFFIFIGYLVYKLLVKLKIFEDRNRGKIFTNYVNQRLFHLEQLLKKEKILCTSDSIEAMIKEIERMKKESPFIIIVDCVKEILIVLLIPIFIDLIGKLKLDKDIIYDFYLYAVKIMLCLFVIIYIAKVYLYDFEICRKYNNLIRDLRLLQIRKK